MANVRKSASDSFKVKVKSDEEWAEIMSDTRDEGNRMAKQLQEQGKPFIVRILAPREMKGGDTIPLGGAIFPINWKTPKRLAMVESARDFISNAYKVDSLVPGLRTALKSVIEGKDLYEHNIGEFFDLYGQFQGKFLEGKYLEWQYQREVGSKTRAKMETLVDGDRTYLKPMKVLRKGGKVEEELQPLPYAVRNILAHVATDQNKLDEDGEELRASIDLLKSWVRGDDTMPAS